jgi:mannobiose 2-epimerase
VVGFVNAYQLTQEENFLDAAMEAADYIDQHFIDHDRGGWYAWVNDHGAPLSHLNKSDGYTCPYHNARMSIEIMKRIGRS